MRQKLGPDSEGNGSDLLQDNGRLNIKAVVEKSLDYEAYGLLDTLGNAIPAGTALAQNAQNGSVACFAGPAGLGHTYWAISIADGDHNPDIRHTHPLEDTHAKLLTMLSSDAACRFAHDLIAATPPTALYVQRSRQLKRPSQSFVSPDGCLVAVGDAAHAMSPAYGQGANVCFEDAVTLALALQAKTNTSTIDALQLYSQERVSRCEELLRKSALRAAQQSRGEKTEDTFKWISSWTPPTFDG